MCTSPIRTLSILIPLLFCFCSDLSGQTTPFIARAKISNPLGQPGDDFGASITVIGDLIAVAAIDEDTVAEDAGMVHVFDSNGNLLRSFGSPNPDNGGHFGVYMTAVRDNQLLISAHRENQQAGRVYLFDVDGRLTMELAAPEPNSGNEFGGRFLLSNDDSLFIPEWRHVSDEDMTGLVYKYDQLRLTNDTLSHPIRDSDQRKCLGRSGAFVGTSQIIIGDPCNNGPEDLASAGAAFLFDLDGNFIRVFENPDPTSLDSYGSAVSYAENRLLIAGPQIDDVETGESTGAAYIYEVDGELVTRVSDPEPKDGNWFGWNAGSMTLSSGEEIFLVGSVFNSISFPSAGKVHLVNSNGEIIQSLESPDPEPVGKFGVSFAQFGDKLLIGESADGGGLGRGPGAVWIFEPADLGDFDLDGDVDLSDLDTLCSELASHEIKQSLDITGDNLVTHTDLAEFLRLSGNVVGDANFDGQVAFDDFLLLSTNFGTRDSGKWSSGDFNCNGHVEFDDFLALSDNFGFDRSANAVPESESGLLLLIALPLLLRMQSIRRRNSNRS